MMRRHKGAIGLAMEKQLVAGRMNCICESATVSSLYPQPNRYNLYPLSGSALGR
jgi:hypothetical protein